MISILPAARRPSVLQIRTTGHCRPSGNGRSTKAEPFGAIRLPERNSLPASPGFHAKSNVLPNGSGSIQRLPGYLSAWANIECLNLAHGLFRDSIPAALASALPVISQALDVPYWKLLYGSDLYISEYLQQNAPEPEDQIRLLQERFRISSIRENITRRIIEDYIRRHPYSGEHLARLDKLCSDRPDKEQLIRKFRDKRYASPGAPLPDAVFEDKNGQEHRLTEFAGKYIYIDLWASWCAPCVAEVPHLQKLEKDLNRRDIVFVSISLDTKRENWEKQMEQLHMHGNQWLVRDEAFADMMNVKGIPHFLLYGKDGTLLDYKTARPSSGDLLKSRLEHLP